MKWWIYEQRSDGRLIGLKMIDSEVRPHAPTLNDGFATEREALVLLGEYLRVGDDGFASIDAQRVTHKLTFVERLEHAILVQPKLVWVIVGALGFALLDLVLLTLHVAFG